MSAAKRSEGVVIGLQVGELTSFRGPRSLRCEAGAVWVTQEGDARDYILFGGQSMSLEAPGRIAVQALRAAQIRL